MKKLFIPLYRKIRLDSELKNEILKIKNLNLDIAYSIQYKKLAEEIRDFLGKGRLFQVLGCSKLNSSKPILLVSDGTFHSTNLFIKNQVYLLDMLNKKIVKQEKINPKGKYMRFLASDSVGILVSIKPGQNKIKDAIKLKKQLKKKSYILIGDNINKEELENFSFDSYINTACPRLDFLNYKELKKF